MDAKERSGMVLPLSYRTEEDMEEICNNKSCVYVDGD